MANNIKTFLTVALYLLITLTLVLSYSCSGKRLTVDSCPIWADDIRNPDNYDYVVEVGFNLGIPPGDVTQQMFDERYGSH